MIKSGIEIKDRLTTLSGEVNSGKSAVLGLLIDELLFDNKMVFYIDTEGGLYRFDRHNPRVRTYMMWEPEKIIELYEQFKYEEEVYVFIDSAGNIPFGNKNIIEKKYSFFKRLKSYNNIKSVVAFNYNKKSLNQPGGTKYRDSYLHYSDFNIDLVREDDKIYLNDVYLSTINELILVDPKVRVREHKIDSLLND